MHALSKLFQYCTCTAHGLSHFLALPSELKGSSRGLVVRVLDSRVVGSIPTLGMVRFWSLGNFINPNLPRYTQLQMSTVSTNIVGKVPAMD